MKTLKNVLPRAAIIFLIFTLLCGVVYTGVVTGFAQLIFPTCARGKGTKAGEIATVIRKIKKPRKRY